MRKRYFVSLYLLLLVVTLLAGCGNQPAPGHRDQGTAPPEGVEVGDRAPDFTLTGVDGARVSLTSLLGKPIMINFWTTLCPYCVEEMHNIQSFYNSHGHDIEVLGVNLTNADQGTAGVKNFLIVNHYTYPIALDVDGKVGDLYLIRNIPTTLFIDTHGVIRFKYIGPMSPETMLEGLAATAASEPRH